MGLFKKKGAETAAEPAAKLEKNSSFFKGLMKGKKKGKQVESLEADCGVAAQLETQRPSVADEPALEDSAEVFRAPALALAMGLPLASNPVTPARAGFKDHFLLLGIGGGGFIQAAEAQPEAIAQILEGAREAIKLSDYAKASRHNCLVLAGFLKEAGAVLDAHGQQLAQLEDDKAGELASKFKAAAALIADAGSEGWLLHLAFATSRPEAFAEVHTAILEIVQGCVPAHSGCKIKPGEYRDTARQFKRQMKQLGSGSVVAGLRRLQQDAKALEEAARLLEVSPEDVLEEIESCADLEAAAASVGAGSSAGILFDGPIRDRECAAVFSSYVRPDVPAMDRDGFVQMLEDFGCLALSDLGERKRFVAQQLSKADRNGDGLLSFAEFSAFYLAQPLSLHRQHLREELGVVTERNLRRVFSAFAAFGTGQVDAIDSFRFAKLCKDSGLVAAAGAESGLSANQVDIIFAQAKPKDARRLDFDGCVAALALIAKQTGISLEEVVRTVLAASGPALNATQADAVRLHDDKTSWTGIYARGGMSVVDRTIDPAAAMVSREDGEHSPTLSIKTSRSTSARATPASSSSNTPTMAATTASSSGTSAAPAAGVRLSLHKLPGQGAGPAAGRAQGAKAAAGPGGRKAVPASARATPRATTVASTPRIHASPAPRAAATATPRTRASPAPRVASLAARTPSSKRPSQVGSHPVTPSAFAPTAEGDYACTATPAPSEVYDADLRRAFQDYAGFGARDTPGGGEASLDGPRFAKLCRETGLLNKALTNTRVDLIFARASAKARRISYEQFCGALEALAEVRGCSILEVKRAIATSEGPQRRGATPQPVRLHDARA